MYYKPVPVLPTCIINLSQYHLDTYMYYKPIPVSPTCIINLSQYLQASTLTYFSTCPFGQLTKKVLVRLNLLVVRKN